MVEAEERRMKDREQAIKEHEERDRDLGKKVSPKSAAAHNTSRKSVNAS
jgi:hypothetical protein